MNDLNYVVTIKEHHLDTFGHVNHGVYFQLFEEARWDVLEKGGYGIDRIRETQIGPTILKAQIRFRKEILHRQKIHINSRFYLANKKLIKIEQRMIDQTGFVYCEAEFLLGIFNMKTRKLVSPDKDWLRALNLEAIGLT